LVFNLKLNIYSMTAFDKKFMKFLDELDEFLDNCPEEEMGSVSMAICRNTILAATDSHMMSIGFTELLKDDLKDFFEFCREEDAKADAEKGEKKN
jgi:hypothetical protein